MYIGGAEHSVLHLMYVRFITMALHDLGYLDFSEPFKRFRANGTITKGGAKISKSKGNVINPDDYINRFGTDAFRLHLMFMLPYEAGGDFNLTELLRELEEEMQQASANLEFERAALLRDQILEVKSGAGISKIEPKRRPVKYTRNAGRRRSRV